MLVRVAQHILTTRSVHDILHMNRRRKATHADFIRQLRFLDWMSCIVAIVREQSSPII